MSKYAGAINGKERSVADAGKGGWMVIRPMNAVYAMGESGRPVIARGEKDGGPALLFSDPDVVSLGRETAAGAGLYTAKPWFKIIGAVELMSEDILADRMDA